MITIRDVRTIPGDSGFLIDDGKTSILYDSGFAFTGYSLADNVKKALGERKLDYIFLTHSHYDHVLGACYVMKYYPEAKVVAGEYAKRIFEKPSARAVMRELDRKFADKCGVGDYEDLIDSLRVDIPVLDGDIIKAGSMEFLAIALPGHTKCSYGFYLESEKLLLSSETLGVYVGERSIIPSFLIGYKTALDSINRALELDVERILIPHFGAVDGETLEYYLSNIRKSTVDTCRELASILKSGGTKEDALQFFKDKFYHGKVVEAYPIDAMELNTGIMIDLIKKELLS
ncbi:MAG: MBL fold metallo-hydrolase [Ruminococcaceae bacterium]|nr:MBL fold metallo-hydrolase [Oscillospiraceae bacterium]